MNKKTTLLIMAAGIGNRFGEGIKQLTKVGARGEILIDYSIHDAVCAGFNKIVFIIRNDLKDDFMEVIGDRLETRYSDQGVEIKYVFQELDKLPEGVNAPAGRKKPWGTTHAIWCSRECIDEPFAVINADDYYGKDTYERLFEYLSSQHQEHEYCMVGFVLKNTLSDSGTVTRGLCQVDQIGNLENINETKFVEKTADGAEAQGIKLDPEGLVSMNMWGFTPDIFPMLEESLKEYFAADEDNVLGGECLIPISIGEYVAAGKCSVAVLPTDGKWFGMTYKEDVPDVVEKLKKMTQNGEYPECLY